MPWLSSKMAENEIGGFDGLPPGPAGMVQRQLEDQLCGRCHAQIAPGEGRHHVEVLLERLQDRVRIQLEIAHHVREEIPLHLGECQEDVLVPEDGMVAPPRLLHRAIDNPLRRFSDLVLGDIEVFHVAASCLGDSSKTRATADRDLRRVHKRLLVFELRFDRAK